MIEAIATAILLGGINTLIDFGTTEYKLEARPIYVEEFSARDATEEKIMYAAIH